MQYHGKAAHAAAAPWDGRNALDAAVLGYMNVAALRQHIRPTERIHGIITKGGDKANIVPAETAMEWIVRSATIESLQPLKQRVVDVAWRARRSACCVHDRSRVARPHLRRHDRQRADGRRRTSPTRRGSVARSSIPRSLGRRVVGSTDMGNVSYLVPSIHPMIKVAADGVAIHTWSSPSGRGPPTATRRCSTGPRRWR